MQRLETPYASFSHNNHFNTVRLTDAEGAEGVGYTYTAGRNGAAIHAILEREIAELFGGEEADESHPGFR